MIDTIITSSVLILVIITLRHLLRGKISSRLQYALWMLVAVRLLLPLSVFESPVSVMNAIPDTQVYAPIPTQRTASVNPNDVGLTGNNASAVSNGNPAPSDMISAPDIKVILKFVWLGGTLLTGIFFAVLNLRMNRKLQQGRTRLERPGYPLPVYMTDRLSSPCLYGIVKPAVYLTPESLSSEKRTVHVLAHELTHNRHRDHLWSFVRILCLCIHWFNPLVWIAAVLSRRDSELACDEGTLLRLGDESRMEYGRTIIEMTTAPLRPSNLFCCATTMTGGKGEMTERIKRIARQPKTLFITLAIVLIVAMAAVALTFGGASTTSLDKAVGGVDGFPLNPLDGTIHSVILTTENQILDLSSAKAEEIIPLLKDLRVNKKELNKSRDSDRDKCNQIRFICDGMSENGAVTTIEFNFNANFSTVWLDNGIKPSFSYSLKKPGDVKAFFERQTGSVTEAVDISSVQLLWEARTPYAGDNSAVGKLLGLLPRPSSLQHDHFSLRTITAGTTEQSGSVKWVLKGKLEDNDRPQLDLNALMLFALIDNLEEFYITIGNDSGG